MELKEYQGGVLQTLDHYVRTLAEHKEDAEELFELQQQKGREARLTDYARDAWNDLVQKRVIINNIVDKTGAAFTPPHISRFDELERTIPNVCLKVPTGGGKTLLGVASIERLQTDLFKQQTGLVLWVVPSDAIYRQTWKQLANREHSYRQMLERASGGRVKLLEKNDAFTKRDLDENLCIMLLMLQSSARKSKETLRMFRDSGRFTSFFPVEDDLPANQALLKKVRNLDCNDLSDFGWEDGIVPGSVSIKQSLGNVLRLVRPIILIDEGHKAYSETARNTLCGFNPQFILELSATPNANGKHRSNILVNVPGSALKDEQMIKLPINVINEEKGDWKHTLTLAHDKLRTLSKEARDFQSESGRYIRPIMLIRVERTGKDQKDVNYVHANDAKKYLIQQLGVKEEAIRLKTSEQDEIGDDDLLLDSCPVKYIITKDALREGWDCPFAYILTVLSKMTAQTAITQMIGRVLRQPNALLTRKDALDECYVFTYDQDVSKAIQGVKDGLEAEGMGDLSGQVQPGDTKQAQAPKNIKTVERRERFRLIPKVFLPKILHLDTSLEAGYRIFDYDRDILGELDWASLSFLSRAQDLTIKENKLKRTIARIDYKKKTEQTQAKLEFEEPTHEPIEFDNQNGLDIPFLVRQLTDIVPNPWQAIRILNETLDLLRNEKSITEEQLYAHRLDLLKEMKLDLAKQVSMLSEALFKYKLKTGTITLRLKTSDSDELNWELAEKIKINVAESEQVLRRKNGSDLEKSLFEYVYQNGLNSLERDTAWYLDEHDAVYWWHRIAVNQNEYSVQGWQRRKVYPDLLVCIEEPEAGSYRFSLLETKGEHLKGNDDTEYKRQLFEVLTEHVQSAVDTGQLTVDTVSGAITFRMLMENTWRQEIERDL